MEGTDCPWILSGPEEVSARIARGERLNAHDAMRICEYDSHQCDTALPQPWVDKVRDSTGIYAPGNVVWSYEPFDGNKPSYFGRPRPLTVEGVKLLSMIDGSGNKI